ncbi:MAG: hypothetical protein MRZ91_06715 [Christensenellaceae bacterium]|nr:hypothetical protein [Christensenellaceae bacterium]
MGRNKKERIIYYSDELNDDFAGKERENKPLAENYNYNKKNIFFKIGSFIIYRLFATPVAFLVCRFHYRIKYINKKAVKQVKGGYFLYINHTMSSGDAFNPSVISFPKAARIVISHQAYSNPVTGYLVDRVGGIPLPNGLNQMKPFKEALKRSIDKKQCVTIYPEAHLWKYYTGIRPFKETSFRYPAEFNVPIFVATVFYSKRKFGKRPKAEVFVDGPFYPDETLTVKQNASMLRNKAYEIMCRRAENSESDYIKYIKIEPKEHADNDAKTNVISE